MRDTTYTARTLDELFNLTKYQSIVKTVETCNISIDKVEMENTPESFTDIYNEIKEKAAQGIEYDKEAEYTNVMLNELDSYITNMMRKYGKSDKVTQSEPFLFPEHLITDELRKSSEKHGIFLDKRHMRSIIDKETGNILYVETVPFFRTYA